MSSIKSLAEKALRFTGRNSALVRRAAAVVASDLIPLNLDGYAYLRERFFKNGAAGSTGETERRDMVRRFETIDARVPIATTPTDGLFLAEMLLNMNAEGALVECGCYAGGSTSKLSILAKILERDLIVCDSFSGLPSAEDYFLRDRHCRRNDDWVTDWSKGRYSASLEQVESNVRQFGELSVCRFVRGLFADTLTDGNIPSRVAFVFADVDLASSARDCLVALWPRLSEGGIFATHDTAYIKVLQQLCDPDLWRQTFRSVPPIFFGAGYGLCDGSPHLGYMVKGTSLSADYLKSLTIDK